jgi:tetratricopeptide (TPR) repeat protein
MTSEEKSLFQNILENRFVKFTLPYIVGAWGIIQVVAFLESRYSWAQGWPDFILVFALIMLPSVLLFSYYRGSTNTATLAKVEKIFIPINLILAIILASFGIGKSDLNNTGSKISVITEEGETIERVVPSISSIKRIVLLPWDFKGDDPEPQWTTFALPEILSSDLEQDSRLIAISPLALANEYNEYNAQLNRTPPFSIQRKMASDNYSDYFMTGTVEKNEGAFHISIIVYNTKDGKEIYTKKYENANPVTIVDLISEDFRKEIYVENELGETFIDLPVSNLYTNSIEALKYYSEGIKQSHFKRNYKAAKENAANAVKVDPNFAFAYAKLSEYELVMNEIAASKTAIQKAMQLKDVLSERMQFAIKYSYMYFESPVKALSLLEMWSQLYPMDYKPYSLLISHYEIRGETEKAKSTAQRALDNGHTGGLLLKLAGFENAQGNMEMAKKYYDRFEKEFPDKANDNIDKGDLYLSQGDFDKAEEHFEKLHLLNPDKSEIIEKLAEVQGKKGNFEKQLEKLDQAIALEKQFQDSLRLMQSKELVYLNKGQIEQYFKEQKKRWQLSSRVVPLYQQQIELIYPNNIQAVLDQGKQEGLLENLLSISSKLDNSVIDIACMAKGNYYIFINDAENLNATMKDCMDDFKKLQTEVQMNVVYAFIEKVNGNYSKAIEHLENIQKASGLDDSYLGFFGEIYRLNKEYEKAENQLIASLRVDPFDAKLLYQLALTYHEAGKNELAKTTLQKAIDVWKDADSNYIPAQVAKANMLEWE